MTPADTLQVLRDPHDFSPIKVAVAQLTAVRIIEELTRDNLLRKLDEVALASEVGRLQHELAMAHHDLSNAHYALTLLKGKV